jgi:hypothetical protein
MLGSILRTFAAPPMKGTAMRRRLPTLLFTLCLAAGVAPSAAQGTLPARPADVGSIDSIITTLYAVISGPVGQPRQWDRFLSLMHPEARLMPTRCDSEGKCGVRVMTPMDYRTRADSFLVAIGFRELELKRTTERYGSIAQAFSSYQSFRGTETAPFARGINSIQLLWDGSRWWILSVYWDAERPGNPLPAAYE